MTNLLTNKELVKELGVLKNMLNPFMNDHFKGILSETEQRLKAGNNSNKIIAPKRKKTGTRIISTTAIKSKYYYSRQK